MACACYKRWTKLQSDVGAVIHNSPKLPQVLTLLVRLAVARTFLNKDPGPGYNKLSLSSSPMTEGLFALEIEFPHEAGGTRP